MSSTVQRTISANWTRITDGENTHSMRGKLTKAALRDKFLFKLIASAQHLADEANSEKNPHAITLGSVLPWDSTKARGGSLGKRRRLAAVVVSNDMHPYGCGRLGGSLTLPSWPD